MALRCLSYTSGAPFFLLLLFFFFLVPAVVPQSSCRAGGRPGYPGIPGRHGANGQDGAKGEKGDTGDSFEPFRGQKGSVGIWGPPGRQGLKGDAGKQGLQGDPGRQGPKGRPFNRRKSFFSLKRETRQTPRLETDINFNSQILPELGEEFQGESMINNSYVSSTSGVYFFSYHISVKSRVCLRLMKAAVSQLEMCDFSEGFLVSSGSLVLQLKAGETVSLQMYDRYEGLVTTQGISSHTFTGFLLFPTA